MPRKPHLKSPPHLINVFFTFFNRRHPVLSPRVQSLSTNTCSHQKHEFHSQCHYINSLLCVSQVLISLSPSQHPPLLFWAWHNGMVYLFNQKTPVGHCLYKVPVKWGHPWLLKHPVTVCLLSVLTQSNICLHHHMVKQILTWNRQPFNIMSQTVL